jgi:type 1 glutamine amidotransferase
MPQLALLVWVTSLALVSSLPGDEKAKSLNVCLVSGALEYDSDTSLAKLQTHLEKNYNVKCSRAFIKSESDLPGLENLDACDVMVLYTRRLKITGEQLERVKKYCLAGKPIVGIRTASHAFQNWLDLDKEVFGGNYKNHFGAGPLTEVKIEESGKDHPILRGVKPFKSSGSLYRNTGYAKDIHLLLTGTIPGESEPIAWTRNYKGGRIFYTSLGHQKDFDEPDFVRLITNAIHWAAKRDVP